MKRKKNASSKSKTTAVELSYAWWVRNICHKCITKEQYAKNNDGSCELLYECTDDPRFSERIEHYETKYNLER